MNEIISRIAAAAGISEETALEAVTVILNFLKKDGPQEQVDKVIAALPGAENLVTAEERGGGMLGGMLGGAMGAMGALNKLTSAGLDMGEIQTVTRELVTVAASTPATRSWIRSSTAFRVSARSSDRIRLSGRDRGRGARAAFRTGFLEEGRGVEACGRKHGEKHVLFH